MNVFYKVCIVFALIAAMGITAFLPLLSPHSSSGRQAEQNQTSHTISSKEKTPASSSKARPVSWNKPSGGSYPVIGKNEPLWIDVAIKKQKVYIKSGSRTLYTMQASTGLDSSPDTTTPTGTYYIQAERGKWFYSPKYKEGAKYWVSWKNHGEFLFHSVPMNQNKQVLPADAANLGKKDSHGCIHLTVPDAKWVYEHIPYNTKVVIHA
ncbi:L,D-transpeptidase [Sporolactobacillus terrae]|uniref:Putative L,D-transpeptidase YciB n=1 Tax=Sporolactobacillus terrae TaxID=269673 RepID=A0A5K7X2I5_9BACL|nr:L,D-transpeptidase [Sporolactobacillus terrae]BBO00225.1 putative L,D-transpeptidase YciB [Sporolactobacillus terrae]